MKQWFTNINPVFCIITALILPVLFLACSGSGTSKKNKPDEQMQPAEITVAYKKPASSFSDTIIILGNSAVFYKPDSLQLEKIKAITDTMVYENNIHDCFYQMRNARIVLKQYWPQVSIIETSKARFLLFIFNNKSHSLIDLNARNDMCGILLFNGKKEPELADMMNIETGLDYYFKK